MCGKLPRTYYQQQKICGEGKFYKNPYANYVKVDVKMFSMPLWNAKWLGKSGNALIWGLK